MVLIFLNIFGYISKVHTGKKHNITAAIQFMSSAGLVNMSFVQVGSLGNYPNRAI